MYKAFKDYPKDKLRELYHSSICTLLLSKRETFSMVALESLVCGASVIGFKNGGTDSWASSNTYLYDYGDIESVVSKIKELVKSNKEYKTSNYLDVSKAYLDLLD